MNNSQATDNSQSAGANECRSTSTPISQSRRRGGRRRGRRRRGRGGRTEATAIEIDGQRLLPSDHLEDDDMVADTSEKPGIRGEKPSVEEAPATSVKTEKYGGLDLDAEDRPQPPPAGGHETLSGDSLMDRMWSRLQSDTVYHHPDDMVAGVRGLMGRPTRDKGGVRPSPTSDMTEAVYEYIETYKETGKSAGEIGERLGVGRSTIYNVINRTSGPSPIGEIINSLGVTTPDQLRAKTQELRQSIRDHKPATTPPAGDLSRDVGPEKLGNSPVSRPSENRTAQPATTARATPQRASIHPNNSLVDAGGVEDSSTLEGRSGEEAGNRDNREEDPLSLQLESDDAPKIVTLQERYGETEIFGHELAEKMHMWRVARNGWIELYRDDEGRLEDLAACRIRSRMLELEIDLIDKHGMTLASGDTGRAANRTWNEINRQEQIQWRVEELEMVHEVSGKIERRQSWLRVYHRLFGWAGAGKPPRVRAGD